MTKEEKFIMYCHKCGTKVVDDAGFCHSCGAKIVQEPLEVIPSNNEPKNTNVAEPSPQKSAVPVQRIERENVATDDFKVFVDNHVRSTTQFQSVDDLFQNSKPLTFIWVCIAIPAVGGLVLGGPVGMLIFGALFGYAAVFITSGIIRGQYSAKFSGKFDGNVNPDEFLLFLNGHLRQLSPYFHNCGYLDQGGGLIATIGTVLSNALKEVNLCCECGPKKKSLATICIRPDVANPDSGRMQYIVGAIRNGFLIDSRAAGFLGHTCLFKTAPIMQAAIEYYLKIYKVEGDGKNVLS